jgi:hypothetical protein
LVCILSNKWCAWVGVKLGDKLYSNARNLNPWLKKKKKKKKPHPTRIHTKHQICHDSRTVPVISRSATLPSPPRASSSPSVCRHTRPRHQPSPRTHRSNRPCLGSGAASFGCPRPAPGPFPPVINGLSQAVHQFVVGSLRLAFYLSSCISFHELLSSEGIDRRKMSLQSLKKNKKRERERYLCSSS